MNEKQWRLFNMAFGAAEKIKCPIYPHVCIKQAPLYIYVQCSSLRILGKYNDSNYAYSPCISQTESSGVH